MKTPNAPVPADALTRLIDAAIAKALAPLRADLERLRAESPPSAVVTQRQGVNKCQS